MKYYTTPHGIHGIEADGSQDYRIEPAWVEIAPEDVEASLNPPPTREQLQQAVQAQIDALEDRHRAARWNREFALLVMENMATPEQLAANFGYQAVKALDDQIAALREELAGVK